MIRARSRESNSPFQSPLSSIAFDGSLFAWPFVTFLPPLSALGPIRFQKSLHPQVITGHRPGHQLRIVDEVPAEIRVLEPAGAEPDAIAADRHPVRQLVGARVFGVRPLALAVQAIVV